MPDHRSDGFSAFRTRDFSFYFGSRFLSSLASMMIDVGVGWLVYELTDSALALGLAGLFSFLPNLIFMLAVGHVADRYDRRRVLILCYIATSIASAGILWSAATRADVSVIYVLIFLFGTARAFASPASQALLPAIISREEFPNALTWNSSSWQFASITGPALGGLAYMLGASAVFVITTLLYLSSLALLFPIKPRPVETKREEVTWETLTAGWRYIWEKRVILGSISVDLFAVLLGGATALLPVFAKDIFETGPLGLGILRAMPAAGAFICTLVIARTGMGGNTGVKMFWCVAIFGICMVGFGLSTSIYVAAFFLALSGVVDMVSVIIRQTLVQLETPDHMRGRVSAVNSIFIGASNELGAFESGAMASLIGPVAAVVSGGFASVGVAAIWAWLFPELRKRDRLT
jgi:MFS family permease